MYFSTIVGAAIIASLVLMIVHIVERQKLLEIAYTYAGYDGWTRYLREIPESASLAYEGIRTELRSLGSQGRSLASRLTRVITASDLDLLRGSETVLADFLKKKQVASLDRDVRGAVRKISSTARRIANEPQCPDDIQVQLLQWADEVDKWRRVVTMLVPRSAYEEEDYDEPAAP